ncbi:MAG TPA: hypothetical protein VIK00_02460 [Candidatus Limnocylindrales bacterium]
MDASETQRLVDRYRALVLAYAPGAEIHLAGSALLGDLPNQDLDLVVLVANVARTAEHLRPVLPPLYEDEWRSDWAAFRDPGPPQVDIVVTIRGTNGDAHHRLAWQALLSDAGLKEEYVRLRAAGMSPGQKALFFDGVVASLSSRGPAEAHGSG